jgi:hypothetical protein
MQREEIAGKVKFSLEKASSQWRDLQRLHTWLLIVPLAIDIIATLLAGMTALRDAPVIGENYPGSGWRITCGIVAGLTAVSVFCVTFDQLKGYAKRIAAAFSCVGRLKALDILLIDEKRSVSESLDDYAKISADYPDLTV